MTWWSTSKISAINLTGSLWDFSNIKYLGQEKEVCFIGDMEEACQVDRAR